ncbi:MAG: hypothetical protein JNL80_18175 [Phycisphaerae bacterium]|nr:hypothetical protein [Phycisphaerae bacterium]
MATTIGGLPVASLTQFVAGLEGFGDLVAELDASVGPRSASAAARSQDADRDAAREAMNSSQWQRAIDLWTAILNANPGDAEAMTAIAQARTALDTPSTNASVTEDISIRRERAVKKFAAAKQRAQDYLTQENFRLAERELLTAGVQLDNDKGILPAGEYATMKAELVTMTEEVSQKRTLSDLNKTAKARDDAKKAAEDAKAAEARNRENSINESLKRVRQLQMELKYTEAIQVLDEILFIDPHNPAALALKDVITSSQMYRKYSDVEKRRWEAYAAESHKALEGMVPPRPNVSGSGPRSVTGLLEYPEDWPQLSIQRGAAAGYRESERDQQTRFDLQKVVSVNFSNNQFDQVINYMKSVTGLDFYADWKALEELDVSAEDTISLDLKDVPAEVALNRILEQLGSDEESRPLVAIEDGVVVVSSDAALRKKTITVVYDIRDLLFDVPMFDNAPEFNLSQSIQQANQGGQGGGGQGGGGGGGGFGGGGGGGGFGGGGGGGNGGGGGGGGGNIFGDEGEDPERRDRQEMIDQIVTIIQEQVDPNGWLEGDGGAALQELNGNLIITNTPRNHAEIEGLLTQLRTIRALQINIESRLINVSLEWFEQIGIDLDLYFNTNNNMYSAAKAVDPNFQLSDFFYNNQPSGSAFNNGDLKKPLVFDSFPTGDDGGFNNPFANTVATGAQFGQVDPNDPTAIQYVTAPVGVPIARQSGWAPIGVSQSSLDLTDALATAAVGPVGAAALGTPALNIGISYLDDIQVDLIIKATQADQRNVVLTAPRVTLFNGQRSWVSVAKAVSFISGLTPITGDSSGAFQPTVGVVYEGFVLDVEAVISADRRYVTMTVQFGLNENVKFRDVTFSGAAGAGDLVGRGSSTFEATFQLPELEGTEIATTVSVPDKGTILLGGQRKLREFEVETGVPVLSKIPIVNRFFTNRVTSKVELTTLLLIRPEVIIQQEDEDTLYPGLRDQLGGGVITQ